jgi:tRNA (cytidine/uridine-2'-O-)-methyltransferase
LLYLSLDKRCIVTLEKPNFKIVLVEPEIPQNTGNIGRTCVATNCELHLVGQLGFEITDAQLKRAGLDYWPHLKWFHHKTYQDWWSHVEDQQRVFFTSAFAKNNYTHVKYQKGDWLVFGKETKGLDPAILQAHPDQSLLIPLLGPARGLNLATAVAVVAYEGVRQIGV